MSYEHNSARMGRGRTISAYRWINAAALRAMTPAE